MADFGTGLRAHLELARTPAVAAVPVVAPPPADRRSEQADDERRRLEALAAELTGRELGLAQREADLDAAQERLALTLARALIGAALQAQVEPPLDELALARARRYSA
jgi:hypothetical protein